MTRFTVDPQDMVRTLLALAAEARLPRRLSQKERQRRRDAAAKRAKVKRREAWARVEARLPKRPFQSRPMGKRIVDRMVAGMEPGRWYGAKDLARLAGLGPSGSGKVLQALLPSGMVERKPNPLWNQHDNVSPRELMAGAVREPKWLYRLTKAGELQRAALALLE